MAKVATAAVGDGSHDVHGVGTMTNAVATKSLAAGGSDCKTQQQGEGPGLIASTTRIVFAVNEAGADGERECMTVQPKEAAPVECTTAATAQSAAPANGAAWNSLVHADAAADVPALAGAGLATEGDGDVPGVGAAGAGGGTGLPPVPPVRNWAAIAAKEPSGAANLSPRVQGRAGKPGSFESYI
jgi:hypothetical protein